MKKSAIFYEAERAVIRAGIHDEKEIIEILKELESHRDLALWEESKEGGAAE